MRERIRPRPVYSGVGMLAKGLLAIVFAAAASGLVFGQRAGTAGTSRVTTAFECANDLGAGVKSRRKFCDVVIASSPKDSVVVAIPARAGAATLRFDLHNRFPLPAVRVPGLAFSRHEAIVSVVQATGDVLGRAAIVREFRSLDGLFDQIGGGTRPGGVKAIAPGPAEPVVFSIPAGIPSVGIVGARLTVLTRGGEESFDTPGRPVAIVSNVRVDYRPATR